MSQRQNILIYECATREYVAAEFHDALTVEDFIHAERQWKPFRNLSAEHSHWDWSEKAWPLLEGSLSVRGL